MVKEGRQVKKKNMRSEEKLKKKGKKKKKERRQEKGKKERKIIKIKEEKEKEITALNFPSSFYSAVLEHLNPPICTIF